VGRLLILRSTTATREIAREFSSTLATAYPARTSDVVEALSHGKSWPGDGIIWVRVERGAGELLPGPPRGVAVGR
jgi:hypothetical protein